MMNEKLRISCEACLELLLMPLKKHLYYYLAMSKTFLITDGQMGMPELRGFLVGLRTIRTNLVIFPTMVGSKLVLSEFILTSQ